MKDANEANEDSKKPAATKAAGPDEEKATPSTQANDEETSSPNDKSGDAPGESSADADATDDETSEEEPVKPAEEGGTNDRRGFWLWVVGVAIILAVELFIYGHNGRIEVCVGVEGFTDWALKGKPRTPDNFRRAPMCAERMNLGMYSSSQDAAEAALDDACRRATRLNQNSLPACHRRDKKWTRQVTKDQVPPWDERLYKRLLWME
jgi:hypothetical protein